VKEVARAGKNLTGCATQKCLTPAEYCGAGFIDAARTLREPGPGIFRKPFESGTKSASRGRVYGGGVHADTKPVHDNASITAG